MKLLKILLIFSLSSCFSNTLAFDVINNPNTSQRGLYYGYTDTSDGSTYYGGCTSTHYNKISIGGVKLFSYTKKSNHQVSLGYCGGPTYNSPSAPIIHSVGYGERKQNHILEFTSHTSMIYLLNIENSKFLSIGNKNTPFYVSDSQIITYDSVNQLLIVKYYNDETMTILSEDQISIPIGYTLSKSGTFPVYITGEGWYYQIIDGTYSFLSEDLLSYTNLGNIWNGTSLLGEVQVGGVPRMGIWSGNTGFTIAEDAENGLSSAINLSNIIPSRITLLTNSELYFYGTSPNLGTKVFKWNRNCTTPGYTSCSIANTEGVSYCMSDIIPGILSPNEEVCSNTLQTIPDVSSPVSLTQSFQSPDPLNTGNIEEEPLGFGESVGKFQSGSGIILRASTFDVNPENLTFEVEVYQVPNITNPIVVESDNFNSTGSGEIVVGNLPAGDYYWKARVVDSSGNESDFTDFETDSFLEKDFIIFEGFEPYPYGYNFDNGSVDNTLLTGGVRVDENIFGLFEKRTIEEGEKWNIFRSTFDLSDIENDERKLIAAFETSGLNHSSNVLNVGSCYGLSVSALMNYEYSNYLQDYYPELSNQIAGDIWTSITSPNTVPNPINPDFTTWSELNDVTKSIASLQLGQKGLNAQTLLDAAATTNPQEILATLQNNPDELYILAFDGTAGGIAGGHVVVPYKVEGNKIYVWDNEVPYPEFDNRKGYNQFFEVNGQNVFNNLYQNWDFNNFMLVKLSDIYNDNTQDTPLITGNGFLLSLFAGSEVQITDSNGNITGYVNGHIVENIPGSRVVIDYYGDINEELPVDNFKQIYFSEVPDDVTIQVSGTTDESYDLMIAGGDYYTKLESVPTSSGQTDTFRTTTTNLEIDFDDSKTGGYNILIDNFQNSGTGTVYIDTVEVISELQSFTIDWTKVVTDMDDAIIYETDSDNDGTLDTSISVPAIIIGEELIEIEEPEESIYIYPGNTISWNSGQSQSISSYYSIVPNFVEYNWGQDIAFTTSGAGNPTVNTTNSGRQSSGILRGGANIQIDVPPVGESYTAYLHIGEYTFEYTVSRDTPPENNVGTLDFGTKTVNYGGMVTSNWVSFPFLYQPTEFILTGDGNPTAQTVNGQRANTGSVKWGTNIKAEIPPSGETRVIEFEILGETGIFTIIRQ